MKKFLLKLFVLTLISLLSLYYINELYVRIPNPAKITETDKFQSVPDSIMISNIGSSHGYHSFIYEENPQCFNFALISQSFAYDYRILLQYQDNLAEDGIMFIPISYFSLFGPPETEQGVFHSKNKQYYRFLRPEFIMEFDYRVYIMEKVFPVLVAYDDFIRVFLGYVPKTVSPHAETPDESFFLSHAKERHQAHILSNKHDGGWIMNNSELEAVYDIIELCKSKNITPILITVPFTQAYTNEIAINSPDFLPEFDNIIKEISEQSGAEYYDYSHDQRFSNDYGLFFDSDHMNETGGLQFTEIVVTEIVERSTKP